MPTAADKTVEGLVSPDGAEGLSGIIAHLSATVGMLHQSVSDLADPAPKIPWAAVRDVPIVGAIAGNGTLQFPDMLGPHDGYHWDIRNLTVNGFSAGTVTVYRNANGGDVIATFTTAGDQTWSKQKMLSPRDNLVFVAAGITGTVNIAGRAIEVQTDYWPGYLT